MNPRVSVLIPVYNAESHLDEALDSIRGQSLADFECITVNDGSTDGSLHKLQETAAHDPRFRVIDQPNGGIVAALNAGLEQCSAAYVARMDADDIALPERLAAQHHFLEASPQIVAVGGTARRIDSANHRLDAIQNPTDPQRASAMALAGGYALLHPTMMIRRAALKQIGGYDPAYQNSEDLDLILRLLQVGGLANLAEEVLLYRQANGTMSGRYHKTYPLYDFKALLAARRRGQPVHRRDLARMADRVSWSALQTGPLRLSLGYALRAATLCPWSTVGPRALMRLVSHVLRPAKP
ncbi:MAG: glycosyltransferase family A protein [Planctomycetota bacterium]